MFVDADFGEPLAGYEVQDEANPIKWWPVSLYEHTKLGNTVLWYGGDSYEGLGGNYRWDAGPGSVLRDENGQEIRLRQPWVVQKQGQGAGGGGGGVGAGGGGGGGGGSAEQFLDGQYRQPLTG